MPGQSRTPQKAGPAKAPTTAPVQAPGRAGNAAAQGSMAGPLEGDPQELLRENTDGAGVTVGGSLPGHMLLGEKDGNRIATGGATGFSAGVERGGIFARFSPPLEVTPGSIWERLATGGITLTSMYYSFAEGKAHLSVDTGLAGDVLDVFMGLKGDIEGKFASAIKGTLPARLQQPGYDPYTDPDIKGLLSQIVGVMGTAFPQDGAAAAGPSLVDQVTSPTVSASVNPKPISIPLEGKMKLIIEPGSFVDLTAHLAGTMGDALKHPKVQKLDVSASKVSIQHDVAGKIAGIDLRTLAFGPDLALQDIQYELGLESTIGALKALAVLFELRTGQDLGVHDTNSPELVGIRKMIDDEARQKLPDLLREQIRANDAAIPGFSLKSLFDGV